MTNLESNYFKGTEIGERLLFLELLSISSVTTIFEKFYNLNFFKPHVYMYMQKISSPFLFFLCRFQIEYVNGGIIQFLNMFS